MKLLLVFSVVLVIALARPEPPRGRFQIPQAPPLRQQLPRQQYGPPPPIDTYGTPPQEYGPPPAKQLTITKNVYVHLPPVDDQDETNSPQVLEAPPPKKHYKLIFIKAPEHPKFTAPIIPVQQQDEHKTLVYVLVKKPDPQPEIVLPTPEPTQPAKPEVYFIKYKKSEEKPQKEYGVPNQEYGAPNPAF